jgi:hypothetical protein
MNIEEYFSGILRKDTDIRLIGVFVDSEMFERWQKVPSNELKLKSFISKELAEFEQAEIEPYFRNCNNWNEQV